jgi:hypothetical protein
VFSFGVVMLQMPVAAHPRQSLGARSVVFRAIRGIMGWRSNVMTWFAILRHAPSILSAAEALFYRAKTSRASDHTRSIEMRIDELAESSRASAELIQDMAETASGAHNGSQRHGSKGASDDRHQCRRHRDRGGGRHDGIRSVGLERVDYDGR